MAREEQIVFPVTLNVPAGEGAKVERLMAALSMAIQKGQGLNKKVAEAVKMMPTELRSKMSRATITDELNLEELGLGTIAVRGSVDLGKQRRDYTKNVNAALENTFSKLSEASKIIKKANSVLLSSKIRESRLKTRAAQGYDVKELIKQNDKLQENLRRRIQGAQDDERELEEVIRKAIAKLKKQNLDVTSLKRRLGKVKSEQRSRAEAQYVADLQTEATRLEESKKQTSIAQQKINEQEAESISKIYDDLSEAVSRSSDIEKSLKDARAKQRKLRTDVLGGKDVGNLSQITDQRIQDLERQLAAQSAMEEDFYIAFKDALKGKEGKEFEPLKTKNLRYIKNFNKRSRDRQRDAEKELYKQEEETNKRLQQFNQQQAESLNNILTNLENATSVYDSILSNLAKLRGMQQKKRTDPKAGSLEVTDIRSEIIRTEAELNSAFSQMDTYRQQVVRELTQTLNNPAFASVRKRFSSYMKGRKKKNIEQKGVKFEQHIKSLETSRKEQDIARKSIQEQFDNDAEILSEYADNYLKELKKYQARFLKERKEQFVHKRRTEREYPSGQKITDDPDIKDAYDTINQKIQDSIKTIRSRYERYLQDFTRQIEDINDRIQAGTRAGVDTSALERKRDKLIKERSSMKDARRQFEKDLDIQGKLNLAADKEERARFKRTRESNAARARKQQFNANVMAGASAAVGLLGQAGFPVLNVGFATLSGGPVAGAVAAVSTAIGELGRAMQVFEDAVMQAADKLGFITTQAKLASAALEGTKAGLSVIPQLSKKIREEFYDELYKQNTLPISGTQRIYEAGKLGGEQGAYKSLLNPYNLVKGTITRDYGFFRSIGKESIKAYSQLSPERQLEYAKEALRKEQLNLMKPLTSIEADPYEVWKRIQTSALDPTKAEEMKLAREQLEATKEIVRKLEEQVRARKSGLPVSPISLVWPFPWIKDLLE